MSTIETKDQLRAALQRALGRRIDDVLLEECLAYLHLPYSQADFEDVLETVRAQSGEDVSPAREGRKTHHGDIPRVLRAISEEIALWQELRLHGIEAQLAEARKRLLATKKLMTVKKAHEFLAAFFDRETVTIRPAYVALFLERPMLPQDYGEYLGAMEPNDDEYFLAVVAFVMNRAYLSGTEAMYYLLTGSRTVIPALFNPTFVLIAYRLALYLQPPGRPSRSLLSEREKGLLWQVGTAAGRPKWAELWGQWNQQHPRWAYDNWRFFRNAHQRAKERLLRNYDMAFRYEQMEQEDPSGFWKWLREMTARVSG